ncbi:MAG: TraR/DksA family transcriptional regulator [Thermodesulfobacteriota bacterium]
MAKKTQKTKTKEVKSKKKNTAAKPKAEKKTAPKKPLKKPAKPKKQKKSTKKTQTQSAEFPINAALSEYKVPFLKQMRDSLVSMRKDLLKDVYRSVKTESDHLRFDVGDFYDHASEDRERELALMLSDREREKLVMIDDALKRIEDGSYGICEVTGEKIGEDRLRALPFTKLSVEAQEEFEKTGEL